MLTRSQVINKTLRVFLENVKNRLLGMRFWFFFVLILGLTILQNGIWYSSQSNYLLLISQNINSNPLLNQQEHQWLITSYFGPLLANIFGSNSSLFSYIIFHFFFIISFLIILTKIIKIKFGEVIARYFLIIFFLSPLSNVIFTWLGSPDVFTLVITSLLVIFRWNFLIVSLCSFLLGINHFEQGVAILTLMTFFSIVEGGNKKMITFFALTSIGFLIIGRLLLSFYFEKLDFNLAYNRAEYIKVTGIKKYMLSTLSNPFALIFSLYNTLYIFVVSFVIYFWKRERIVVSFLIYNLGAIIAILFTLDQTRVFSILTFPSILLLVFSPTFIKLPESESNFFKKIFTISFFLGLLIPRYTVWEGSVFFSSFRYLLEPILSNVLK